MPMYSTLVAILLAALLSGLTIGLFTCFSKLYQARMLFRNLIRQGMPVAPNHSFLFGHLLFIQSVMTTLPKDAHQNLAFGEAARRWFAEEGAYYIDLWPFSEPMLIVVSAALATQATQTLASIASQKPHFLRSWFRPITGGPSIFEMPETEWKPWRAIFNRAFSPVHLLSLVPGMVAEARIYCDVLRQHARDGDMFYLDPMTLRYMMDVIGRNMLNTTLGAQKGYNLLADSMRSQIKLHQPSKQLNPLAFIDVVTMTKQWLNSRRMDSFIGKELDKHYSEYRAHPDSLQGKSIMDLVLRAYMAEQSPELLSLPRSTSTPSRTVKSTPSPTSDRLDPEFRAFATSQVRVFFFAGHDSTSSTICYMMHLLSTHPDALSRVRGEHDAVFGRDLAKVPDLLAAQPQRLNELPYSLAAIKETTRLFLAASAMRYGRPGVDLVGDGNGAVARRRYPTAQMSIWVQHAAMQRMPENHWLQPDEFLPKRWLVGPGHELYPDDTARAAWRPFEHGPRNCPGQALVFLQLRVVLVLVAREFDFVPAYAEYDVRASPRELAQRKGPVHACRGERVYQVEAGAAHPADNYPCRVALNPAYVG